MSTSRRRAFRMNFQNLVTATVVGGLPSLQNAGATRFPGVRGGGGRTGDPKDCSARATYSFHDGRFTDFIQDFDGTNTQLAGKRFEMSARHLFSAGLIVAPDTGVVGSVIVKHTGDRYLNKRNTALAVPFTTLDVGLGYRLERMGSESRRPEPDRQARLPCRKASSARRSITGCPHDGSTSPSASGSDVSAAAHPPDTAATGSAASSDDEHLVSAPCLGGIQGHVRGAKERSPAFTSVSPSSACVPDHEPRATPTLIDSVPRETSCPPAQVRSRKQRCTVSRRPRARQLRGDPEADRELVAAVSAGDRIGGQPRGRELADVAHRLGAGQVPVRVVQRLQPIEVEHQHRYRCAAVRAAWIIATRRLSNDRRLCRPVRSSVIASTWSRRAFSVSLRRHDPDGNEQRYLYKIRLAVREREQGGIREVIEDDGHERRDQAAEPAQPRCRDNDGQVIKVLDRAPHPCCDRAGMRPASRRATIATTKGCGIPPS